MTTDRRKSGTIARRGFTLAEATLAMVLLGVAAAGVLLPFSGGATVQAEGVGRTLGAILANDLIERIVDTPFDEIVVRYGSRIESEGQVEDASGTRYADSMYAHFSREVTCAEVFVPQETGDFPPNFILATVTVHYQGRPVAAINRLIGK